MQVPWWNALGCSIAFLDEVFLGSTAILNMLLAVLNERRFRRGHAAQDVPLRLCVAASNTLPEDVALAAFADRFLVRVFVSPVPDTELEALLTAGARRSDASAPRATLEQLDLMVRARRDVDLGQVRGAIAQAVRLLRRAGVALTDRRIVRSQNLIAAASALRGATVAGERDLWPLLYVVPTALEQETACNVLREHLAASESPLVAAANDASTGPLARAARIAETAEALLSEDPQGEAREAWKLRLEGVLREIDASFSRAALPEPLPGLRQRIGSLVA